MGWQPDERCRDCGGLLELVADTPEDLTSGEVKGKCTRCQFVQSYPRPS